SLSGLAPTSTPTPLSTPTPGATPSCPLSPVTLPFGSLISGGVTLQNQTPAPSAPTTLFSGPFNYFPTMGFVLRNSADWSNFYSPLIAPTPPVDFSTQMILVLEYQGCFDQVSFSSVCVGASQVTAVVSDFQSGPHCTVITTPGAFVSVAVPQSSLPVSWQLVVY